MARLYADEDFPLLVVDVLRQLGHDVVSVHEAGRAGLGVSVQKFLPTRPRIIVPS